MIEGLKPYAEYKQSGIAWLPAVPRTWRLTRARYLLREVDDRSPTGSEQHLSMSQKHGLVRANSLEERRLVSESYVGAKRCQANDIVLNRLKAHLGVLALAREPGLVSPDYTVLRICDAHVLPDFLVAVLTSAACRGELVTRVRGLVEGFWRLYTDDLYAIPMPVPSLAEQRAIVRFLDYADRRIRKYIAAKRKLIALLEEQKRAIIDRAVTRGLDPNVRLKDSGVPWIGMVPEHWEVLRLRRILREGPRNGISPPAASSGGLPTFSISALRNRRVRVSEHLKYADLSPSAAGAFSIRRGDLLVVRGNGNLRLVGRAGIVEGAVPEGCIYPDILIRLVLRPEVAADFVVCALDARPSRDQIENYAKTATGVYKISGGNLSSVYLAMPPPRERDEIAAFIASVESSNAMPVAALERELALVHEYCTRLVSDVVTGKLDVREAAARLPDEPSDDITDDTALADAESGSDADGLEDEESAA